MTYRRMILKPETEKRVVKFRSRNALQSPAWVKAWTNEELDELDDLTWKANVWMAEQDEEAEDAKAEAVRRKRAIIAALPQPALKRPNNVKARIALRTKWARVWRQAKSESAFRTLLLAQLRAALEVARRTHEADEVDRVLAEINALEPDPIT